MALYERHQLKTKIMINHNKYFQAFRSDGARSQYDQFIFPSVLFFNIYLSKGMSAVSESLVKQYEEVQMVVEDYPAKWLSSLQIISGRFMIIPVDCIYDHNKKQRKRIVIRDINGSSEEATVEKIAVNKDNTMALVFLAKQLKVKPGSIALLKYMHSKHKIEAHSYSLEQQKAKSKVLDITLTSENKKKNLPESSEDDLSSFQIEVVDQNQGDAKVKFAEKEKLLHLGRGQKHLYSLQNYKKAKGLYLEDFMNRRQYLTYHSFEDKRFNAVIFNLFTQDDIDWIEKTASQLSGKQYRFHRLKIGSFPCSQIDPLSSTWTELFEVLRSKRQLSDCVAKIDLFSPIFTNENFLKCISLLKKNNKMPMSLLIDQEIKRSIESLVSKIHGQSIQIQQEERLRQIQNSLPSLFDIWKAANPHMGRETLNQLREALYHIFCSRNSHSCISARSDYELQSQERPKLPIQQQMCTQQKPEEHSHQFGHEFERLDESLWMSVPNEGAHDLFQMTEVLQKNILLERFSEFYKRFHNGCYIHNPVISDPDEQILKKLKQTCRNQEIEYVEQLVVVYEPEMNKNDQNIANYFGMHDTFRQLTYFAIRIQKFHLAKPSPSLKSFFDILLNHVTQKYPQKKIKLTLDFDLCKKEVIQCILESLLSLKNALVSFAFLNYELKAEPSASQTQASSLQSESDQSRQTFGQFQEIEVGESISYLSDHTQAFNIEQEIETLSANKIFDQVQKILQNNSKQLLSFRFNETQLLSKIEKLPSVTTVELRANPQKWGSIKGFQNISVKFPRIRHLQLHNIDARNYSIAKALSGIHLQSLDMSNCLLSEEETFKQIAVQGLEYLSLITTIGTSPVSFPALFSRLRSVRYLLIHMPADTFTLEHFSNNIPLGCPIEQLTLLNLKGMTKKIEDEIRMKLRQARQLSYPKIQGRERKVGKLSEDNPYLFEESTSIITMAQYGHSIPQLVLYRAYK